MVRKENYSPFQIYIRCMKKKEKTNSERDIFILAAAMLKVMCILNGTVRLLK